jgi:hypothetical protein
MSIMTSSRFIFQTVPVEHYTQSKQYQYSQRTKDDGIHTGLV